MLQNRFQTLNSALEAEGLLDTWWITFPSIPYGGSFSYTHDDGSKYGRFVSVYRFDDGAYERPVTYLR